MQSRGSKLLALLLVAIVVAAGLGYWIFIPRVPTETLMVTAQETMTGTSPIHRLIWFAPLPPMPERVGREFIGSVDFMKLFAEDAPWTNAAHHVDVFKLLGDWVIDYATDVELRQAVADLNRRGIAIAFEAGALIPTEACGMGVEGFDGPGQGVQIALRIKAAGGTVRYVSLDEPFAFGSIYSGPNACHWPAEKVSQEVADYIRGIKSIFPNVIVGETEPLWADVSVDTYKHWLQTYRAVTGSQLSFFHFDNDFTRPDWADAAKELENFSHDLGISFGIIYLGNYDDTSDGEWVGHGEERMVTYEIQTGGRPDHVIFQSWEDHPDYLLPESDPTTFTHLIDRYFRTRTTLILAPIDLRSNGSMQPSGILTDSSGLPVSGAGVEVSVTPLDGPGVFGEYIVSGIVPDNATRADVGFRVNTECECLGTTDFSIYTVRYVEGSATANRVPNPDFSQRLQGWGFWGNGTARLESNDRGAGQMLYVAATYGQPAAINSAYFPVNGGVAYTLTFSARVSPASVGSGYFAIFFLTQSTEVARARIPLKPAAVTSSTVTTDDRGAFRSTLIGLPSAKLLLEVSYAGDDQYMPAYVKETI